MHYENMRLRIVQIEHDISKSQRAQAVAFQGTGHVNSGSQLRQKPSTGQLGRRSPPPPSIPVDDDEDPDDYDLDEDDDAEEETLGLQRFPSGAAQPPRAPPDLEPDEGDDDYDDEPVSPEEPDEETVARTMKGDGNELLATMYEGVRKCRCQGESGAPKLTRMWELPESEKQKQKQKPGVTLALAEVAVES